MGTFTNVSVNHVSSTPWYDRSEVCTIKDTLLHEFFLDLQAALKTRS